MKKIIYSLLVLSSIASTSQSLRTIYQEGMTAYEEKNYEDYRQKMLAIDSMRPNYPAVVYNLASGYALTGNIEKSIEVLNKYILMDATHDFTKDQDFQSVLVHPDFLQIQDKQKKLTTTIKLPETHSYPILASHPESVTYSKKLKAFFIGGVRDGSIWKVPQNRAPEIWAESTANSWSVMGLQVSRDEKILWACTASMNNYDGYKQNEAGFSSVLKYDLKSGKLLETYALPGGHAFGDLIVDAKGNVYVSDGQSNKLFWISKEKMVLEEFADISNQIFNLQGLTLDSSGENLFLSDYIDGIYKLNLQTKALEKLEILAEDVLIKGIDGLYFHENSLIGLHNGTKPNRIVKYGLSEDQDAIRDKEILAQAGILGEPTQGVFIDGSLHFIMNSPWGSYDQDGNFEPKGDSIIIGVLNLSNY